MEVFLPLYDKTLSIPEYEHLDYHRNHILSHNHDKKDFKNFAYSLIKYTFPKCYFEGLKKTIEITKKLNWPINPKFILTSNAYDSDEIFKFYTALNLEKNVSIIFFNMVEISEHPVFILVRKYKEIFQINILLGDGKKKKRMCLFIYLPLI